MQTTSDTLPVGGRLPDLALPAAPDGAPVSLRARNRDGTVVVMLHSAECEDCQAYLASLGAAHEQLREWDGRVLAVVPAGLREATKIREEHQLPFPVLADTDGKAAARCGVGGGSILIADQWGELFLVQPGVGDEHSFPAAAEVSEWLRYVAIQCPECQGEAL